MTLSDKFKASIFLSLLALSGCGKENLGEGTTSIIGTCGVSKTPNDVVCLDFDSSQNISDSQSFCQGTFYSTYQGSVGANGNVFVEATASIISCSSTNSLGKCDMNRGKITYYTPVWDNSTAQSDCQTTHSGTWTAI